MTISSRRYSMPPEKFEFLMREINRSPIRKKIYQLVMKGGINGKGEDTILAANGKDGRGIIIQCLNPVDAHNILKNKGIHKVLASKEENENKYKNEFDVFVIANSKTFENKTMKFAKINHVKLVSRKDLLEFISQVKIS